MKLATVRRTAQRGTSEKGTIIDILQTLFSNLFKVFIKNMPG